MRARLQTALFLFIVGWAAVPIACKKPEKATPPTVETTPAPTPVATTPPAPEPERVEATPEAVAKAKKDLEAAADLSRRMRAVLSFDEFKATVYREPFEGGKFIVNGDTPIANEKLLQEFFELNVKPRQTTELIVDQISGMDNVWNSQQKGNLTYCVTRGFGARYDQVVEQMANATSGWEAVAAVHYVHDASQDATCGPTNATVVFDVSPVNSGGQYLARAFFPNEGRASRNVLIDESSFELDPDGKLQLVGILRHELGHTLGFRHEHTRPDSGACFEDRNWRPLTNYDAFSVMHYPQCNGRGDWSLDLTVRDKNGVACLYGVTPPFALDPAIVDLALCAASPPTPVGTPQTESFTGQSVAQGAQKEYGPFTVAAGSLFEAKLGGATATGDPDLYVRFGAKPAVRSYDCRPFVDGPEEVCSLTVPATSTRVFVMVRGYTKATYDLQVSRVAPGGG